MESSTGLFEWASLALVLPLWFACGKAAQWLGLPLITGYLLAGVASGPQASGIVTIKGLKAFEPLNRLCLGLIALAAGAELELTVMKKSTRQVVALSTSVFAFSWASVFAYVVLYGEQMTLFANLQPVQRSMAASLAATLAGARSPASAIAVLRETQGKGPFCSLALAVVVVKDILVFVAFAVNIEVAKVVGSLLGVVELQQFFFLFLFVHHLLLNEENQSKVPEMCKYMICLFAIKRRCWWGRLREWKE
jgi:Kef-type K+ transport system membrane component KefB